MSVEEEQEVEGNTTGSECNDDDETTTDAKIFFPSIFSKPKSLKDSGALIRATYDVGNFRHLAKPLIFDHKRFSPKLGLTPRHGTTEDRKNLVDTFLELNCAEPEIHRNKRAGEIRDTIKEVSRADHSDFACLIVAVLTHGEENALYAFDEIYETSALWEPFVRGLKANPTLAGKPKIFIIQACRGGDIDEAQEVTVCDAKVEVPAVPEVVFTKKIPRCADILIANSSVLGYMSVRNQRYGSWFIQTLCRAIAEYKSRLDLLSILTVVKHNIAYNRTFAEDKKQIPCTESTLTKMLFLLPPKIEEKTAAQ